MGFWGEVIGGPRTWARELSLAVAIGVALAFLGPFGSYAQPLEARLVACVTYGVAGAVVFWPLMRLFRRLGARAGLPDLFTVVAALLITTGPVAFVCRLLAPLLFPSAERSGPVTQYFGVLAVVLPFGLAMLAIERLMSKPAAAPLPATADVAAPRLLARLPGKFGRELLALQAEDHYVRVHTREGSTLLLMRLADAIAELDGLEGLRVHRSWWVAKAAVEAVRPDGRKLVLTLVNGLSVPVTREATPVVRSAGWG